MAKLDDAKKILKTLGLPPKQQNDVAAYTLLALGGIRRTSKWSAAEQRPLRIHDMIVFTNAEYRVPAGIDPYKENTRETFRRQAIHQFEQARVVDRNVDSDDLATNSPNTQYALSSSALAVIRSYGTKAFAAEAAAFGESQVSLLAVYTASKRMHLVPVKLADGREFTLSPGKHNQVQAAVVRDFAGALRARRNDPLPRRHSEEDAHPSGRRAEKAVRAGHEARQAPRTRHGTGSFSSKPSTRGFGALG